MSLKARMGLAAGVAVAIAVIAVAVSAYAGTSSQLIAQTDASLRHLAQPVLLRANGRGGGGPGPDGSSGLFGSADQQRPVSLGHCGSASPDEDEGLLLDQVPGQAFGAAPGAFTLVCRDGTHFSHPAPGIPIDPRAKALAASGKGQYFTSESVRGQHIRVMATGIGARGALLVGLPLADVDSALSNERLLLALIAAGGIALAALLGVLVARAATAPIVRFTRQTERIAARPDRLEHERVEVKGNDELARLARTFNATLDALDQSVQAQRNLVADASHELRTPIATIRANIQMLKDEHLLSSADRDALRADVIDELDELTALVADVVELARGSKQSAESGDVRLDEIVSVALDRARRRAPGLSFEASLEPTLVRGEGERIARAVSNLLGNAAKWSPEGGVVEVDLRDGALTVRDHGPGFNESDLPFVFDRFHRAREARSKPGSGLGLAIVKQAAEAHGGFVEGRNAPDGGAILRISFGQPLQSPADLETTVGAG